MISQSGIQVKKKGGEMISVGIDISKDRSMICFMKPGGGILEKPYEIAHSRESINELIKRIKEQEDEVRVIMEHTGLYHYPLLNSLLDAHIFVSPINGYRMKRYCSQSIRKVKNDRIDSTKIASYGLTYWNELECFLQPNEIYRELRALSRQYYTFTAMKVKAKVNVDLLITKTMPGIKGIVQDNKCNHRLTDFVLQYVHYDNITKNKEYVFITRFLKWAEKKGFRMEQQTAEKIYRAAKIGIPIIPYSPSTKTAITEAIKMLYSVESSCDLILAQMQDLARQLPEFETVRGMQGVGTF